MVGLETNTTGGGEKKSMVRDALRETELSKQKSKLEKRIKWGCGGSVQEPSLLCEKTMTRARNFQRKMGVW